MQALKSQKEYESDKIAIQHIPIAQIEVEKQVRQYFDDEKLSELADSIREHGIQNPIHVRFMEEGKYVVITGERRFKASQKLNLEFIPCIVHKEQLSENDIKALQLIENLQRQDLTGIEIAKGFEALAKDGMNPRAIARTLGISEATISKGKMVLKRLSPEWIDEIEKNKCDLSLNELYNIAKEASRQKRAGLYQNLMKKYGQTVKVEIEEKPKEPKKNTTEFSEEEWDTVWEYLKRLVRRDKTLLGKFITPKKVQEILDEEENGVEIEETTEEEKNE